MNHTVKQKAGAERKMEKPDLGVLEWGGRNDGKERESKNEEVGGGRIDPEAPSSENGKVKM